MLKKTTLLVIFFLLNINLTFTIFSCSSENDLTEIDNDKEGKRRSKKLNILANQIVNTINHKKKPRIAITNFTDIDGRYRKLGKFISEELISRLYKTKKFKIIERRKLDKIMKEHALTSSALFDNKTTKKLGKLLGVDAIVSGTMTDIGSYIKVNARVINIETGEITAVASVKLFKDYTILYLWQGKRGSDRTYPYKTTKQSIYKKEGVVYLIKPEMLQYKDNKDQAYNKANSQSQRLSQREIRRLKDKWETSISLTPGNNVIKVLKKMLFVLLFYKEL
jgi:curli biogenesis system outer membrane secretion channel CsgG